MRNFKLYLSFVAVFAMLFTSCSKDEETGINPDSDKATLSFGAIVSDLVNNRAATKQAVSDLPDCSDDTPSYVEIVLSMGGNDVVGSEGSPYRVDLVAGEIFTVEDAALELEPGDYSLDHFSVYNSTGDLIWLSPRSGSPLASFVDNALPIAIDLRAGVKKYVDVPVLCFDDRDVNEYGYLFFELDANVALTYCFFANYCDDDGRHYPARYSVSIWSGTSNNGVPLYEGVVNEVGVHNNGDSFATPLCFALPDNDDMNEDYLYYEVTLLDWAVADGGYGDVDAVTMNGTLSKADIVANFDGDDDVDYHHLRFCGDDDPGNGNGECDLTDPTADCDNDGVLNGEDECPSTPGPASNNGCPESSEECEYDQLCDIADVEFPCVLGYIGGDAFDYITANEGAVNFAYAIQATSTGTVLGELRASFENGDLVLTITPQEGFSLSGYVMEVIPADPTTGEMSTSCRETACASDASGDGASETFTNIDADNEIFYVRFKSFICPPVLE